MTEVSSKQERQESFPMLRVGGKFASVKLVAEESSQGLIEEDVCDHEPPSYVVESQGDGHGDVDHQLC